MPDSGSLQPHADSIIEILAAQCADLEALLALARQERATIEGEDFDNLLGIVEMRASIGARLETYHRQISDLRVRLNYDAAINDSHATRTFELINQIQLEDANTRIMLTTKRAEMLVVGRRLDSTRRGTNAYLRDARATSVACDVCF